MSKFEKVAGILAEQYVDRMDKNANALANAMASSWGFVRDKMHRAKDYFKDKKNKATATVDEWAKRDKRQDVLPPESGGGQINIHRPGFNWASGGIPASILFGEELGRGNYSWGATGIDRFKRWSHNADPSEHLQALAKDGKNLTPGGKQMLRMLSAAASRSEQTPGGMRELSELTSLLNRRKINLNDPGVRAQVMRLISSMNVNNPAALTLHDDAALALGHSLFSPGANLGNADDFLRRLGRAQWERDLVTESSNILRKGRTPRGALSHLGRAGNAAAIAALVGGYVLPSMYTTARGGQ